MVRRRKYSGFVIRYWIGTLLERRTAPITKHSVLLQGTESPEAAAQRICREFIENGFSAQVTHTDSLLD